MEITLLLNNPPGGRCRLYQAYGAADGVIISPQDLGLVLDEFHPGAPRLELILDEVLERCMQEWS